LGWLLLGFAAIGVLLLLRLLVRLLLLLFVGTFNKAGNIIFTLPWWYAGILQIVIVSLLVI
jgi:hypothetical protein